MDCDALEDQLMCFVCMEECTEYEEEFLHCSKCEYCIHLTCLADRIPSELLGDLFFSYVCPDCSNDGREVFKRKNVSWLEAIALAIYNLQDRYQTPEGSGFFHYKTHIAEFLEKHSVEIFGKDFEINRSWHEVVADVLFRHSSSFFTSACEEKNDGEWWALTFPTLTPSCIAKLDAELKIRKEQTPGEDEKALLESILVEMPFKDLLLETKTSPLEIRKRKIIGKTEEERLNINYTDTGSSSSSERQQLVPTKKRKLPDSVYNSVKKYLDPFCLYKNKFQADSNTEIKLTGNVRNIYICSPYTGRVVKPYIFKIPITNIPWLNLMDDIIQTNKKSVGSPALIHKTLDFVYLQPELVPAINTLCNQFLWSGIDVTPALHYPDFTCVVLYGKLVVAFGILVPDTDQYQSYLSFLFTRPNWRNSGIGRYMIYHLCQTNRPRDVTVHVSINSNSIFLFNKFRFIREHQDYNFYTKYDHYNKTESEHAFYLSLKP